MKKLTILITIFIFSYGVTLAQNVVTNAATNISYTTVTLNGTSNPVGHPSDLHYGIEFEYGTTTSYGSTDGGDPSNNSKDGTPITLNLTGLSPNTTYHYRIKANYIGGTDYGADATFTTLATSSPTVSTGSFGSIGSTSGEVTSNEVTDDGGAAITSYGLAYGLITNPTTEKESGTSGTPPFTYTVSGTGLNSSVKYFVRAYARNSVGTSYGVEKTFYTDPNQYTTFDSIGGLDANTPGQLTLYFGGSTQGNGNGVIIKAQVYGHSNITQPVDGDEPSASTSFLGDNQVVYLGTNSGNVTITNLDPSTDYEFQMWEYSGLGNAGDDTDYGINYNTSVNPQTINTSATEFPIELLSFTAKNDNGNVLINWSTASETDNDFFEVERSTDAENFEIIANVPGAGYSNGVLNYSIQDNAPLEGTVYYRLKQTDFNGAFTYSYMLPVHIGADSKLQISNIISTNISISFIYNNNEGGNTLIEILDMNGRVVRTRQVSGTGSQRVRINMRGLSRGIYVLNLTLDNQMIVKKVVY